MISSPNASRIKTDQLLFNEEFEQLPISPSLLFQIMDPLMDLFLFVKNIEGHFIAVNHAFHQNTIGAEKRSMLGKSDLDFFPYNLAHKFMEDDKTVFKTKKPLLHRVELIPHTDLSIHWYETHKYPILDSQKKILGLIGTTHKLSESHESITNNPAINRALIFLRENFSDGIKLEDVAKYSGLEPRTLNRHFYQHFKITPIQFLKKIRINAVCQLLIRTDKSVSEISYDTGYSDQSHLNRDFLQSTEQTPLEYRKKYMSL